MHYFCVHAALGRKQIPRDSAHKHAKVKKARSLSSSCKCKTLTNTYVVYLINAYIQTRQLNLIKKYRTCISGVISVVTCHSLPCN